jgi:hypothetical protein
VEGPLTAVQAMLGERPTRGEPLTATLQEVKPGAKGPMWVALIAVTGRAFLQAGETLVNARIQFAFSPPRRRSRPGPGRGGGRDGRRAWLDHRGPPGAGHDRGGGRRRTHPTKTPTPTSSQARVSRRSLPKAHSESGYFDWLLPYRQ